MCKSPRILNYPIELRIATRSEWQHLTSGGFGCSGSFALFAERGCEHTTIDDITERAGVGRTTFFRALRTKEDVIFPDHDVLPEAVESRLAGSTDRTALIAVTEVAGLGLRH